MSFEINNMMLILTKSGKSMERVSFHKVIENWNFVLFAFKVKNFKY